jgi:hypothetical protein
MTARIGATPVPGPTHTTGVFASVGREMKPFIIPTRRVSPGGDVSARAVTEL